MFIIVQFYSLKASYSLACINITFVFLAKGEIDKGLASLATALSAVAANLEEDTEESPTIVIDTEET